LIYGVMKFHSWLNEVHTVMCHCRLIRRRVGVKCKEDAIREIVFITSHLLH